MSEFCDSKFDSAIDTFIELDLNPAKVVALYPDSVAGRLSVAPERWIPLHGGPDSLSVTPPWSTNGTPDPRCNKSHMLIPDDLLQRSCIGR